VDGQKQGMLRFDYLQKLSDGAGSFAQPSTRRGQNDNRESLDMGWLFSILTQVP
jgi:hypothetical protein